ncbi:MAG: DMT family transporter [Bdellovibrionales bacterium]
MKNYQSLLIGTLCIAFAPILVKLSQMGAAQVGLLRCLFGAIAVFLYLKWIKQNPGEYLKWKYQKIVLLGGLFFMLDLYSWHLSIHIVGAGFATILANTQVFFAAILSRFLFQERLGKSFIIYASLGLAGIALLSYPENGIIVGQQGIGIILGIMAGFLYSCFMMTLKKWNQVTRSHSGVGIFYFSIFTGLWFVPNTAIELPSWTFSSQQWLWVILLGVVVHGGGWVFIQNAIKKIPMKNVSLVLLLQPILATTISYYLFDEYMSNQQIAGAALTLFSVYLGSTRST